MLLKPQTLRTKLRFGAHLNTLLLLLLLLLPLLSSSTSDHVLTIAPVPSTDRHNCGKITKLHAI
jgi:hypothetical protein